MTETRKEIVCQVKIQTEKRHISDKSYLFRKSGKHEIALCFRDKSEFLESFTVSFAEKSSSTNCNQCLLILPSDLSVLRIDITTQEVGESLLNIGEPLAHRASDTSDKQSGYESAKKDHEHIFDF